MSKFTKALEKIQHQKEQAVPTIKEEIPLRSTAAAAPVSSYLNWFDEISVIRTVQPDPKIIMHHFPNSHMAEQYRILRTNLKNEISKDQSKVILISSSINSEGKTLTSANLALALAEMGDMKVLLIDADLRRGKAAEYLGISKKIPGLSNFLNSEALNPFEFMIRFPSDNLVVMPRGEIFNNAAEMVSSNKFRTLIAQMRQHFDLILIDSPPIMSVADAGILGKETDGLLMVIQAGRTPKTVIGHSHILFKQAGIKIFGYVLSNVQFQSSDYRYYYYAYDQEHDRPDDWRVQMKKQLKFFLEKLRYNFEQKEKQFNEWWEKRVLAQQQEKKPQSERPLEVK